MIDPDLKRQLDLLNKNVYEINQKSGRGVWRSFFSGIMGGLGYMIGIAIAIGAIGWILNALGVIPAFKAQVHQLQQTLDQLRKTK